MAWWEKLQKDRFIRFRQEALKQRPDLYTPKNYCPAAHIVSANVWFPFTVTLDDYAAFLTLSSEYLESNRTGGPIEIYTVGTSVLMWHAAIWDYIGQSINMLCDWVNNEEDVDFETATNPQTIQQVSEERLRPIPKASLEKLTVKLRAIWGSTSRPPCANMT